MLYFYNLLFSIFIFYFLPFKPYKMYYHQKLITLYNQIKLSPPTLPSGSTVDHLSLSPHYWQIRKKLFLVVQFHKNISYFVVDSFLKWKSLGTKQ